MLKFFEIEKTYHKLTVRLYVDCLARKADMTVTYDRRIVARGELDIDQHATFFGRYQWLKLDDPNQAEQFLSQDCGERGNFMEATEYQYRNRQGSNVHIVGGNNGVHATILQQRNVRGSDGQQYWRIVHG